MTRTMLLIGFATGTVALAIACSSSSSSNGSSGGTSGSTTGTSGSATGTSGSTTSSGFKQCSSSQGTCTQADFQPFIDCESTKCGDKISACYGPNWQQGSFGGTCGDWITCTQKCDCGNTSCTQACGLPSADCQTCLQGIGTCAQQCQEPACAAQGTSGGTSGTSGTSGGSGHTCAELATCCGGMSGQAQTQCQQAHDAAAGSDPACNAIFTSLGCH